VLKLENIDSIYLAIGFLVPGLIVLFIRAQFLTGTTPPHAQSMLSYLTISVIYYAFVLPIIDFVLSFREQSYLQFIAWFSLIFVGPVFFGLLLGVNIQKQIFRRILQSIGLNPVHVMPTAWDWKFGGMKEQWVLVTLKDDACIAGFCGAGSFISSDPDERDIYIELIYDIGEDNNWYPRGETSILIAHGEIKTVEFWPLNS